MDNRILFCTIILIMATFAEECMVWENTPCLYTCDCVNRIQLNVYSLNRISQYNSNQENCQNKFWLDGYLIYPLKIIYHNPLISDFLVPEIASNNILVAIYHLDLSNNGYEDCPQLQHMPNLKTLNISRNQITTAKLSNLQNLEMLTELDLSFNNINNVKLNENEYSYIKLTKIDFSHNYLVKIPQAIFDDFKELRILDFSNNYIDTLSPFTFEGIKKLTYLNLSNNRITDINSSLFRFSDLKILNLSGNRLREVKFADIEQLVNLVTLDLNSNLIKSFHSNIFNTMTLLKNLDLSNNQLENINKNSFSSLSSLESINLSKNKLKTLPVGLFNNTAVTKFVITENMLETSLIQGMFDGINVIELDLSNQFLKSVEDYAFGNLIMLESLLLNSNSIQKLSENSFKTLVNLKQLDLSNNQITLIEFSTEDLHNLHTLILEKNDITEIKHEHLIDLDNLEYLDISNNIITRLEPSSFKSLKKIINLKINNNPLVGALETDTFDGLVSLPTLDISHNLLNTVHNSSFNGMTTLRELNISTCKIKEIEYNAFINTGYIEILDLSYNNLAYFFINMTELVGLTTLLLNNNLLSKISTDSFSGLLLLNKLQLSQNLLENIDNAAFDSLVDLRYLDLAYNTKLNVTWQILDKKDNLQTLILSGVRTAFTFKDMDKVSSTLVFIMSNASVENISDLGLNKLVHLNTLCLNSNNVSKLVIGDFSGLTALLNLDLSFNKISYVQPGVFKENTLLISLNISHNFIASVSYGIFRGLIYLSILDMSYNRITDLQTERFYEVQSLTTLIVDFNEIDTLNAEEFVGTTLRKLSIGNNRIPCQTLVKLKQTGVPFVITSIKMDEHTNENIDGISCNNDNLHFQNNITNEKSGYKENIVKDLEHILLRLNNNRSQTDGKAIQYLEKLTKDIEKSNFIYNKTLPDLVNLTNKTLLSTSSFNDNILRMFNHILQIMNHTFDSKTHTLETSTLSITTQKTFLTTYKPLVLNDTNNNYTLNLMSYINKIKKELKDAIVMEKHNIINEIENKYQHESNNYTVNIMSYINKIKKELKDAIVMEKHNIINEIENKFNENKYQTESLPSNITHEKLISNHNERVNSNFTEICVALILFLLVAMLLYKFYKSRIYIRNRLSISTRELPGAMDNSTL